MNEPRRLLDDDVAPNELRELLRVARPSQRMTAEQMRRGARRVGAATTLAAGWLLWVKGPAFAALIGAAGGLVVATGVPLLFEDAPAREQAATPVVERAASPQVDEPAAPPAPEMLPPPAPEPAPSARTSTAPRKAAVEAPSPRDTLAAEALLIEQARQSLGSDPARSLALLERHQREFAHGKLGMERELLFVDALRRSGRRSEAKARAEALLRLPHKGIYGARLEQLLSTLGE